MIIVELEDLRSGLDQTIDFPGVRATVRLTEIARAAAEDSGAWTGLATLVESELQDEVNRVVHRTARRTAHQPPFAVDCRDLPPVLDGAVRIVRLQVGDGGPELTAAG
jgi:hypothetical protein